MLCEQQSKKDNDIRAMLKEISKNALRFRVNFEILDKFNVYNSDTKLPAVAWAKIRTTNI